MSRGPGRRIHGWLLLGGLAGLAASPVMTWLRREVSSRMGWRTGGGDPVAPFLQAPCGGGTDRPDPDSAPRPDAVPGHRH